MLITKVAFLAALLYDNLDSAVRDIHQTACHASYSAPSTEPLGKDTSNAGLMHTVACSSVAVTASTFAAVGVLKIAYKPRYWPRFRTTRPVPVPVRSVYQASTPAVPPPTRRTYIPPPRRDTSPAQWISPTSVNTHVHPDWTPKLPPSLPRPSLPLPSLLPPSLWPPSMSSTSLVPPSMWVPVVVSAVVPAVNGPRPVLRPLPYAGSVAVFILLVSIVLVLFKVAAFLGAIDDEYRAEPAKAKDTAVATPAVDGASAPQAGVGKTQTAGSGSKSKRKARSKTTALDGASAPQAGIENARTTHASTGSKTKPPPELETATRGPSPGVTPPSCRFVAGRRRSHVKFNPH